MSRVPWAALADRLEGTVGFESAPIREGWPSPDRYLPADRLSPERAEELFWSLLEQAGIQHRLLVRLVKLMRSMRGAQREYYQADKSSKPELLKRARVLEDAADRLLKDLPSSPASAAPSKDLPSSPASSPEPRPNGPLDVGGNASGWVRAKDEKQSSLFLVKP